MNANKQEPVIAPMRVAKTKDIEGKPLEITKRLKGQPTNIPTKTLGFKCINI